MKVKIAEIMSYLVIMNVTDYCMFQNKWKAYICVLIQTVMIMEIINGTRLYTIQCISLIIKKGQGHSSKNNETFPFDNVISFCIFQNQREMMKCSQIWIAMH